MLYSLRGMLRYCHLAVIIPILLYSDCIAALGNRTVTEHSFFYADIIWLSPPPPRNASVRSLVRRFFCYVPSHIGSGATAALRTFPLLSLFTADGSSSHQVATRTWASEGEAGLVGCPAWTNWNVS